MAKEKQTRRMIAMALAAAVTMSSVPVVAFAEEDTTITVSGEGTTESPKVTLTVEKETDSDTGNVTYTETKVTESKETSENTTIVSVVTESTTSVTDATGAVTTTSQSAETVVSETTTGNGESGSSVEEGTETTIKEKDGQSTPVEVPVIGDGVEPDHYDEDGNPVFKNTDAADLPEPEVSGDEQQGENDPNYDYTVKEETPREVEVTITDTTVTYDKDADAYEGKQDLEFMTPVWNGEQKNLGGGTLDWFPGNPLDQTTEGYDYTPYGFMHNDVTHMYYIRTDKEGGMVDKDGNEVYYYDAKTDTFSRSIPKEVVLYDIAYQNTKPLYYKAEDGSYSLIDGNDETGTAKIESVVFQSNSMMVAFYDKSQTHSQETWDAVYDDLMAMGTAPTVEQAKEFYAKHPDFLDIIDISKLVEDYQDGVVSEETTKLYNTIFALWEKEKDPKIYQFDAAKNVIPAYCVDVNTGTIRGTWYELMNVEDAGYYSTERTAENGYVSDADRIKAIALNGYWGTRDAYSYVDEATGKTVDVPGEQGSLSAMKAFFQARLDEATAKGETLSYTQEDIDGLTHGCALSITQHSLWRFGNSLDGAFMDAYTYAYDNRDERNARIERFIEYFTTMPVDTKEFEENEVITTEKYIGEMSLTVGDRVEGHENNTDASSDNDAYNTELSFSLVVTPGQGDDLVVSIVSGDQVLAKARIAGDGSNDDDSFAGEGEFVDDGNGNYTFKNLTLIENSGQTFSLNLEGAQYLEQGVYLFKSAGGAEASQTYATIASGQKAVDLEMEIDLTFNVEEGSVKETRKWKKTSSWNSGNNDSTSDPEDPTVIPEDEVPLTEEPPVEIGEEDVPLADAPVDEEGMVLGAEDVADAEEEPMVLGEEEEIIAATGDSNHMTAGFGGMLAALAGMLMLRKKKEN